MQVSSMAERGLWFYKADGVGDLVSFVSLAFFFSTDYLCCYATRFIIFVRGRFASLEPVIWAFFFIQSILHDSHSSNSVTKILITTR